MADKMMRMAGRDSNGRARGLAVTEEGLLKSINTGSVFEVEKILDNRKVLAGQYTGHLDVKLKGNEKEVWVYLTNTKAPILLLGSNFIGDAWDNSSSRAPQTANFFPSGEITGILGSYSPTHPNSMPAPFFYYPNGLSLKENFGEIPQNYEEARRSNVGYRTNNRIGIHNNGIDSVTVNLWVVRVYG